MSKKRFPLYLELATFICTASADGSLSNEELQQQVLIGRLPQTVLTELKIPDLDVVTSVSVLSKLARKHKLGPGVISGLRELIGSPSAVFRSATMGGSIVLVSPMTVAGKPLIAALAVDASDAYMKPNIHWLSTAFPKENTAKFGEWERAGLLLWRPKKNSLGL